MFTKLFKRSLVVAIVLVPLLSACTPHKWFIVNSEGILSYDRNKGTFELLWQNKSAGFSPDSGSVVVDSIMFKNWGVQLIDGFRMTPSFVVKRERGFWYLEQICSCITCSRCALLNLVATEKYYNSWIAYLKNLADRLWMFRECLIYLLSSDLISTFAPALG